MHELFRSYARHMWLPTAASIVVPAAVGAEGRGGALRGAAGGTARLLAACATAGAVSPTLPSAMGVAP